MCNEDNQKCGKRFPSFQEVVWANFVSSCNQYSLTVNFFFLRATIVDVIFCVEVEFSFISIRLKPSKKKILILNPFCSLSLYLFWIRFHFHFGFKNRNRVTVVIWILWNGSFFKNDRRESLVTFFTHQRKHHFLCVTRNETKLSKFWTPNVASGKLFLFHFPFKKTSFMELSCKSM